MKTLFKYYTGSIIFTIVSLFIAGYVGYLNGQILNFLFITFVLGILEVSLSFDNAIVNAKILKDMDPIWQRRFLTWGIAIAVFGMRIVFPLLIVMIVAQLGPIEALQMAIEDPKKYEITLKSCHHEIVAFGGTFLLMVGLSYFFDREKDTHWIKIIEKPLSKYGKLYLVEAMIVIIMLIVSAYKFPLTAEESVEAYHKRMTFLVAGLLGLIVYAMVQWVETLLEGDEIKVGHESHLTTQVAKSGLASFLYLEVLDASFSFDGVIGAFALSNNIFIIALGLGIGAMFVRSMTVMLVEKGTIDQFKYLEHGAFWAIIALGLMMFVDLFTHVNEVVTGIVGAILIGLSIISSIISKKNDAKELAKE